MKIAIIGAGMAGLACAAKLKAHGFAAHLFDKGRGPSGRMSTRRMATPLGEASFDIGAQYFTARDSGFVSQVKDWERQGLAAPWPEAGPDAYVGTPTMHAPLKHQAANHSVQWNARVTQISRQNGGWLLQGEGFATQLCDVAVVALPAEQTAALLQPVAPNMAAYAAATPSQPCWTVMAAFERPLPCTANIFRAVAEIGWAARNSAKPGRSGPEAWVVQAAPDWSAAHLEETTETIATALLTAFAAAAKIEMPQPLLLSAHRWRFARAGNAGCGNLWDAALGLGACGDWLLGPRVECAWVSGTQLAGVIAASG